MAIWQVKARAPNATKTKMNQAQNTNNDFGLGPMSFYHTRARYSKNMKKALSDEMEWIAYHLDQTIEPKVRLYKRTWSEYMESKVEKQIYSSTIGSSESFVETIIQYRQGINVNKLAKIMGVPAPIGTEGILFWRLAKRLYYIKYGTFIPKFTWASLTDVFNKLNYHPRVGEDFLHALWTSMHWNIPLGRKWLMNRSFFEKIEDSPHMTKGYRKEEPLWFGNMNHMLSYYHSVVTPPPPEIDTEEMENQMFSLSEERRKIENATATASALAESLAPPIYKTAMGMTEQLDQTTEHIKQFNEALARFNETLTVMSTQLEEFTPEMRMECGDAIRAIRTTIIDEVRAISDTTQQGLITGVGAVVSGYAMVAKAWLGYIVVLVEALMLYLIRPMIPVKFWYVLVGLTVYRWFNLGHYATHLIIWINTLISKQLHKEPNTQIGRAHV